MEALTALVKACEKIHSYLGWYCMSCDSEVDATFDERCASCGTPLDAGNSIAEDMIEDAKEELAKLAVETQTKEAGQ